MESAVIPDGAIVRVGWERRFFTIGLSGEDLGGVLSFEETFRCVYTASIDGDPRVLLYPIKESVETIDTRLETLFYQECPVTFVQMVFQLQTILPVTGVQSAVVISRRDRIIEGAIVGHIWDGIGIGTCDVKP